MKRVALYVRVSTQEQKNHGLSVDNQIAALQEYADFHGYSVIGIYNDAGISARKKYTKRPALLRLLKDCEDRKVDLILFTRIDRWFRNMSAYYQVQDKLDRYGVKWNAIWEDYEVETSSGVMRVNIMLSVAQAEADRGGERVKSVFEYKKSKGEFIGKRPTGYNCIKSHLYVNETEKDGVHAFFNTFLQTFSVSEAISAAAVYGVKITLRMARYMLENEIYTGSSGLVTCEPYITREEHEKILMHVQGRKFRKTKNPDRVYLFSGLCYCGQCGKAMSPFRRKAATKEYLSYRCYTRYHSGECSNKSMGEIKLEAYLMNEIEGLVNESTATAETEELVEKSEKRIKQLQEKLRRIGDRYEDCDIDKETYHAKRNAVLADIAKERAAMSQSRTGKKLPSDWRSIYEELDKEHRRAFWHMLLNRIEINGDDIKVFF